MIAPIHNPSPRDKRTITFSLLFWLLITAVSLQAQPGRNVELLGQLRFSQAVSDVWGYADGNGNEYALVGLVDGTAIVDVTDATAPAQVAFIPGPPAPPAAWRDIKTHSNYAYIVTEGSGSGEGMQVVDMSDPANAALDFTFDSTFTTAHNLYIDDGYAYVVGTTGAVIGFHILDLTNPEHPVEVGTYNDFYVHDVFVRNNIAYACAFFNGSYEVLDVSNKSNPTTIASFQTPMGNAHANWTTEDGQYLLTTDEIAGGHLLIWDISNLANIELVAEYESGNSVSIHNVFVKGSYAHVSYYEDGYRVVDISDPANPVEVGYYDTQPEFTANLFDGAWGVYPYAPSGNIYISDTGTGLYVVRFTEGVVPGRIDGFVLDQVSSAPIAGAEVRLIEANKYLHTDANGFWAIDIFDGHHTIVTSANGYFPDTTEIELAGGGQQTLTTMLVSSGITAEWQSQTTQGLNFDHYIYSIAAVDENVVWAVATTNNSSNRRSRFLRTTDGGNTWTVGAVTGVVNDLMFDMAALDANTAWVTTNTFTGSGGIFKTTDGGTSWTRQHTGPTVFIHFFDDQNGVQINRQLMHTTTNGGATWSRVPAGNIPGFQSDEFTILYSSTNNYHAAVGDTIWFGTSMGRVYRSTNRGRNWTASQTSLDQTRALHSLAFQDASNGVAASAYERVSGSSRLVDNRLSRTVDGGDTWFTIDAPVSPAVLSLTYVPETAGNYVLVSQPGSAYSTGARFDWIDIAPPLSLRAVAFASPDVGWAGSFGGGTHLYKFSGSALTNEGAQISVSPPIIDFGLIGIGDSATATVTIKSAGTEGLTVGGIASTGVPFSSGAIPSLPALIPTGSSEAFDVIFAPVSMGEVEGAIVITSDDLQDATVNITLHGEGLATASLNGTVKDSLSGAPIMTTLEFVRQGETTPRATVTTNPDGSYEAVIVVGMYDVHVAPEFPYPQKLLENVEHSTGGTTLDLLIKPPIIALVADDSSGAASQVIGNVLNQAGFEFGLWNTRTQGETIPADRLDLMAEPRILIWLTGEVSTNVLTSEERATIIGHLEAGNTLILSGENIAETTSANDMLMSNYLGVEFVANTDEIPITGFAGDPIGDGLIIGAAGSSKDRLRIVSSPGFQINKAFHYGTAGADTVKLAAIRAQNNDSWMAVYFGFGMEKVSRARRRNLIERTINWLLESTPVSVDDPGSANLPRVFSLQQNYPNPFNPTTVIRYGLPTPVHVKLVIYNILGEKIRTLVDAKESAGYKQTLWDGRDHIGNHVASGLYLYRLEAGDYTMTQRMVLMK